MLYLNTVYLAPIEATEALLGLSKHNICSLVGVYT